MRKALGMWDGRFQWLFSALVPLLVLTACGGDGFPPANVDTPSHGHGSEVARLPNAAAAKFWPSWRGPLGTGVAPNAQPPTEWGERKNVRWKVPLLGLGHSTPVLWDDKIFLTSAVPVGKPLDPPRHDEAPGSHDNLPITHRHQYVAACMDRATGELLWQKVLHEEIPTEGGHTTGSLASHSPVTDGKVVVFFFGSRGLYGLDCEGNELWRHDLGQMQTKHGHGESSSPALHGNSVVVSWDHEGQSFLVAFDKATGEQLWKRERDEVTSWSSPVIVVEEGRAQVIVSGTNFIRGYDLVTGDVIWKCSGLSNNIVATPVVADGVGYFANSYNTRNMLAIRFRGATGDITGSDCVMWVRRRGTPYIPTPLLYDGALYFMGHYQNVLSRVDATSGENRPGPMRLPMLRDIYASPVAAAGRIYITGRDGTTVVLSHADEPEVLSVNHIDDAVNASLLLVDREIFIRGEEFLYCIAADEE